MLIFRVKITPDQPPLGSILYQLAKGIDEKGLGTALLAATNQDILWFKQQITHLGGHRLH